MGNKSKGHVCYWKNNAVSNYLYFNQIVSISYKK